MRWLGMTMWTLFAVALTAPLLGFLKERMQNKEKMAEPDGAANGSQPFSTRDKSSVIGCWLPSLTFALCAH